MEAGTIIAGLSVSEIETSLVLDSNDIMVVIGEYDIYSDSQVKRKKYIYWNINKYIKGLIAI